MKMDQQFTYSELQELAIVLEVDIRLAERLGIQSSEITRRLLAKVNRMLLSMGRDKHYTGAGK